MPPPNDYWIIYVSVFVPLVIVVTGIILAVTLNKPEQSTPAPPAAACASNEDCQHGGTCDLQTKRCLCTPQYVGDRCQTLYVAPTLSVSNCGVTPKECTEDGDCYACSSTEPYTCQEITPEDNTAGLEGKFCLPAKPDDNCGADVCKDIGDATERSKCYSTRIPGTYFWQGWSGVDTQAWSCNCDYPLYYRPVIGSENAGACMKAPELCKHGKWIYPCKTTPEAPGVCLPMSKEEEQELIGSQPLYNGKCECSNVPCAADADCASNVCQNGVCQYQRTALDPQTGLPTCVLDTCQPNGAWIGQPTAPYAYGRCVCNGSAIDTGFSCYLPPPPDPVGVPCPSQCSGNGLCMPDGTCLCNNGYTGTACEDYKCDDGCVERGECIAANQCTCEPNTVYAGLKTDGSPNCLPQISCYPEPSVEAATGKLQNPASFPNKYGTACEYGTVEMFTQLCKKSPCSMTMDGSIPVNCKEGDKFDGYRSGKCYKNVDCSTSVCKDPLLCGPQVLPDYVADKTVYKVPLNSTTCGNPSLEEVKDLCMNNRTPRPEGSTAQYVFTSNYTCENAEPQYKIAVKPTTLSALSEAGITGSLCIPGVSADQKASDGNGIIGLWRIWLADSVDQPVDPTASAYAGGLLFMQATVPDADSPCAANPGYFYAFEASFTGTPAATLPPNTPVVFAIFGIPLNKWTCPKGETNIMNCVPLYYMQLDSATNMPYLNVTLQYDPNAMLYSASLTPVFQPCVAYQLTQNAYPGMSSWTTSMLAAVQATSGSAVISSTSVEYLAVAPPPECNQAMVSNQGDLFVQVACMDTYCQSFGGGAGSKLIVIAWNYIASTTYVDVSASCTDLNKTYYPAVKYRLTRQYSTEGPKTLVGPSSPLYITSDAKYAYYVDVLPVQPLPWTYTLVSYVARSTSDSITTYDVSPCKSRPLKVTISIEPYNEAFCQSLPPPDPSRTSPSMMWLNPSTGMCEWMDSQANQAAGDYDCAIRSGEFNPLALSLVNRNGKCARLEQSYPALDPSFKWLTPTCDPGSTYDKSVCMTGVNQMRAASCSQTLRMEGGEITDATQFSERISNLYKFYDLHYPGDKSEVVQNALTNPSELYKEYYHCGLDPEDPDYDPVWGTVGPCNDIYDAACAEALKTATRTLPNGVVEQVCGVTNKCYSWEDVSMPGSPTKTFQQRRQCFPSSDYENAASPCCSYHGTYAVDLTKLKGVCACTAESTFTGDQCQTDLCLTSDGLPIDCGGNGTCQYNKDVSPPRVMCKCSTGFYNRKKKNPRDPYPAEPDDFQCNKNKCPTYYDDFQTDYGSNPNAKLIQMDKTPCGSNPFFYMNYPSCTLTVRASGKFDDMTLLNGSKVSLKSTPNLFGNTSDCSVKYLTQWKESGQCNEETGLCMCGDLFRITNDNMCVLGPDNLYVPPGLSDDLHVVTTNYCYYGGNQNEQMCPDGCVNCSPEYVSTKLPGKTYEAEANGRYGDVVWAYRGGGYMCDAATKACKYVEAMKVDDFKFPTRDCNCFVVDAGSTVLNPAEHPVGYWGAGQEVLVPIGEPFTASKPFVHVRAPSTGTVYVTGGYGSDLAGARYILVGFGNVVANTMDAMSTNPVVLWGQEASGGRSSTSTPQPGYIPGFTPVNGNARVEVGKTYKMYIRVWDQTDDIINLSWPAFTVTQTDNLDYVKFAVSASVSSYITSMTYTPNTPPLLFNNYWVKAAPQLGAMYSPDGKYKVYVNPLNGSLTLVNNTTGAMSVISPSASDVTLLYLDKVGRLHLYDVNYVEKWASPSVISTATIPPYTVQITNDGIFQIVDRNKVAAWTYSPNVVVVPASSTFVNTGNGIQDYKYYRVEPIFKFYAWKPTVRITASAEVDIDRNDSGSGTDRATFAMQLKQGDQQRCTQPLPQNVAGSGCDMPTLYSSADSAEVSRDDNRTNSMDQTFTNLKADGKTLYTVAVRINMRTDDPVYVRANGITLTFT